MSFFTNIHVLPGTHTASYTSSVSNQPFGAFYQFVFDIIKAIKG